MPLPGFYPCLTLQLNVTMHQSTQLGKFVLVVREPNDHIEIARTFQDLESLGTTIESAKTALDLALVDMIYMQGNSRPR